MKGTGDVGCLSCTSLDGQVWCSNDSTCPRLECSQCGWARNQLGHLRACHNARHDQIPHETRVGIAFRVAVQEMGGGASEEMTPPGGVPVPRETSPHPSAVTRTPHPSWVDETPPRGGVSYRAQGIPPSTPQGDRRRWPRLPCSVCSKGVRVLPGGLVIEHGTAHEVCSGSGMPGVAQDGAHGGAHGEGEG